MRRRSTEPGHGGGQKTGHHHQNRPPDAGHQQPVAAQGPALGPGLRRRSTASTAACPDRRRRRPGHLHRPVGPGQGHPGRAHRTSAPPRLRRPRGALEALAGRFSQRDFAAGDVIAGQGDQADEVILGRPRQAHQGRHRRLRRGDRARSARRRRPRRRPRPARPRHVGLHREGHDGGTVLTLDRRPRSRNSTDRYETLQAHVEAYRSSPERPQDRHGQAEIALAAGHHGEAALPGTFVDYETSPREYELSVAQTVLRVHSRVADLYNDPMNQVEQQLRLTIEGAARTPGSTRSSTTASSACSPTPTCKQRLQSQSGPPTPDDMDDLLCRRRKTQYFVAHPQAIAAFGRECTKRRRLSDQRRGRRGPADGLAGRADPAVQQAADQRGPDHLDHGHAPRPGQPGRGGPAPDRHLDEYQPGLNVRFMGVDDRAVIDYLVSAYYSGRDPDPRRPGRPGERRARAPMTTTETGPATSRRRSRGAVSWCSRRSGRRSTRCRPRCGTSPATTWAGGTSGAARSPSAPACRSAPRWPCFPPRRWADLAGGSAAGGGGGRARPRLLAAARRRDGWRRHARHRRPTAGGCSG